MNYMGFPSKEAFEKAEAAYKNGDFLSTPAEVAKYYAFMDNKKKLDEQMFKNPNGFPF